MEFQQRNSVTNAASNGDLAALRCALALCSPEASARYINDPLPGHDPYKRSTVSGMWQISCCP
jgi:hypothetical protein